MVERSRKFTQSYTLWTNHDSVRKIRERLALGTQGGKGKGQNHPPVPQSTPGCRGTQYEARLREVSAMTSRCCHRADLSSLQLQSSPPKRHKGSSRGAAAPSAVVPVRTWCTWRLSSRSGRDGIVLHRARYCAHPNATLWILWSWQRWSRLTQTAGSRLLCRDSLSHGPCNGP